MKEIKVLGTGCANCKMTYALIEKIVAEQGVAVKLEKVEDLSEIIRYGVLSTPGVIVDGRLVHSGGIPSREQILAWLT